MRFRMLSVVLALTMAMPVRAAEVRLCELELRTIPLSEDRGVQSALVQEVAVVNTGSTLLTLGEISFQILQAGQMLDERRLAGEDIARAARQSEQVEVLASVFPSQFCNGQLLAGARLARSDRLAPGEALVFSHQPFVWRGKRDNIRIVAKMSDGNIVQTSQATLPIVEAGSRNELLFPIAGRSYVGAAADFHSHHRWARIEEFALDIAMLGPSSQTYRGKGEKLADYAAFGKPVRAVAAGNVVIASDGAADNAAMLKRASETEEAYLGRLQQGQLGLLKQGMAAVLGNHVVIDLGNGEYAIYAHLKRNSLNVQKGQAVVAGQVIGAVGSSGNSTEPHLHFQLCDGPDISACRPVLPRFKSYRILFALSPRAIQTGDIVETTR